MWGVAGVVDDGWTIGDGWMMGGQWVDDGWTMGGQWSACACVHVCVSEHVHVRVVLISQPTSQASRAPIWVRRSSALSIESGCGGESARPRKPAADKPTVPKCQYSSDLA